MNTDVKHTNTDIIHLISTLIQQLVNEDYRHAWGNASQITDLIQELHMSEVNARLSKAGA